MADEKQDNKRQAKGGKAQGQKARKPKAQAVEAVDEQPVSHEPPPPPRLKVKYQQEIAPALRESLGIANVHATPKLEKIVISMGLGKAVTAGEKGKMEQAEKELSVIAGQKPVRCKAKKSVANFKVREGQETGLKVTLRGGRMYEFLDRLISLAIPRVKDFRGLRATGFDAKGNYNFGLTEQTVFPEVDPAAVTFQQGMNITVVTTAHDATQGKALLKQLGMPLADENKKD